MKQLSQIPIFPILWYVWISSALCHNFQVNASVASYRLPKSIQPVRYILTMEPLLEADIVPPPFIGSVIIEMKIFETTKNITVHVKDLNIMNNTIAVVHSNGTNVKIQNTATDEMRDFYIIQVEDELQKNEAYNLTIGNFSGTLNSNNYGFYLAKYTTSNGQERKLALTQFEPYAARLAFPCFDEPAFKAKFIVNLIRSEDHTSVSNEALIATVDLGNGRFKDTFKETACMSSYVVAFVVSNYKHTNQVERIRVLGKPEAIDDGEADYILLESSKLLTTLENYTGINYVFTKMDLLGVPDEYFSSGAMENWGLVIFSELNLLYSNNTSTTEALQRCTTYTAHELAHQWFGNLVTPMWWKYMWLSEGFAAYFQFHISDVVEPSWRLTEQYVTDHFQLALENDDIARTQPMNYEPHYYGSLPSAWITYYKACAVITMTQHFLSRPVFQKGLSMYLQKNKFTAAKPVQLYAALQTAVEEANATYLLGNLTVSDILSTWDTNRGYPLVTAIRNYNTGAVRLSQSAYRTDGSSDDSSVWYIPISYVYQLNDRQSFSETTPDLWFKEKTIVIDNNFVTDGWLLLNKKQTGYYRVNYDITNWQRIIKFLTSREFRTIHAVNRAQLIDDSFHLAESGQVSYEIPLNLSKYIIQETDLIPINSFLTSIKRLDLLLSASEKYDIFQNYVINLLSGALDYLGFEDKVNDEHTDKLNRMNILKWLCNFGHSECKNIGLQKLRRWRDNGSITMSPDTEEQLLCGAIQIATQDEWNFLYEKYYSTKDISQKSRYIKSLGCSKNDDILKNMFKVICNENNTISLNDRAAPIKQLVQIHHKGMQIALNYLDVYCSDLDKTFKYAVGESIGERITTSEQLTQALTLNGYDPIKWYGEDNLKLLEKRDNNLISNWLVDYSKTSIESHNVV